MDVTRAVMTAVSRPNGVQAPINSLLHLRSFPEYTMVEVTHPNADTLYTTAWLDLTWEPMVLSVPRLNDQYYLFQALDAWTNIFASIGTRTTGIGAGSFAIVGPGWKGSLPPEVMKIQSPTTTVCLAGRTQIDGRRDVDEVHRIQDRYLLTPLSGFGGSYAPPKNLPVAEGIDWMTSPSKQVARMDAYTFFRRFCSLMETNPPMEVDSDALRRFSTIGIVPGQAFGADRDPLLSRALEQSLSIARERLQVEGGMPRGRTINGWRMSTENAANYGTDYVGRAVNALHGASASLPADIVSFSASETANGIRLKGSNRYVIRFRKEELPPVNGLWSVTMYDRRQTFVPNPIGRYALGDRDALTFDDDGGLSLFIQQKSPGPNWESNWLPAPPDTFSLMMRLYWPRREGLEARWRIPPIEAVG